MCIRCFKIMKKAYLCISKVSSKPKRAATTKRCTSSTRTSRGLTSTLTIQRPPDTITIYRNVQVIQKQMSVSLWMALRWRCWSRPRANRVRSACMRLSDLQGFGNYTVKAIGESVGYKVYGTFINVFKKATGITPSMYQKLTLEEANMA